MGDLPLQMHGCREHSYESQNKKVQKKLNQVGDLLLELHGCRVHSYESLQLALASARGAPAVVAKVQ